MKNIALINALDISDYFSKKLDGKPVFDRIVEYTKSLPDIGKICVLVDPNKPPFSMPESYEKIERKQWHRRNLLDIFKKNSREYGHAIYYYADCPFLDMDISNKMYQNHKNYFSDYTFADGYPYGLTPEIIRLKTADSLLNLEKENQVKIERNSLFELIKKDINSFDIETEISPVDQRLLRIDLCADTKRNFMLIDRIGKKQKKSAESITEIFQKYPSILRTLPAFFNIQIVEGCPQNCSYCPYPGQRDGKTGKIGEMEADKFSFVLDKIEELADDGYVSFSLWGEPSYHSAIIDLCADVLNRPKLELIIETSGLGWREDILSRIRQENTKAPHWIVSMDAWLGEVYRKMRGGGYEEAAAFCEKVLNYFPETAHIQAVRMNENEDDLEHFFKNWKKKTENVIIQKYDDFCGKLDDRKVADLSPLKRFPCWHIKRDLIIFIDGEVRLCREDLAGKFSLGNIFSENLEEIWNRGGAYYDAHLTEQYDELCRLCDEYYTYNF